ncbi:MAG: hypothetical protein AB2A00_07340 [Myxococcota bacterium]
MTNASVAHRAAVCRALLERVDMVGLWTEEGPTSAARRLRDHDGEDLTDAQRFLLMLAWDVWNGTGHADMSELLRLDVVTRRLVAALLGALAGTARDLDAWLERARR